MTTQMLRLNVELSAVCNYSCVSCPNTYMSRPKGHMSPELFRSICGEVEPFLETLYLWNYGEPLLHPQIESLIESLAGSRIQTVLSTTGYMLEKLPSLDFLATVREVIISLNGLSPEVYDVHQQGGDFHQVLRGLRRLAPIMQKSSTRYVLQFVANRINADQIAELEPFARNYGFKEVQIKSFNVMNESTATHEKFVPKDASLSRYDVTGTRNRRNDPCLTWMVINWDGEVNLCCWDYLSEYKIGNVETDGVLAIWHSEPMKSHRKRIEEKHYLPICGRCAGQSVLRRFSL